MNINTQMVWTSPENITSWKKPKQKVIYCIIAESRLVATRDLGKGEYEMTA
jgi:hypothetical protein